jgi:hypothetical protein
MTTFYANNIDGVTDWHIERQWYPSILPQTVRVTAWKEQDLCCKENPYLCITSTHNPDLHMKFQPLTE